MTQTHAPVIERRAATPRDTAVLRELFADAHDDLLVLPPDTRDVIVDMQFRALRRRHQNDHPGARRELLLVDGVLVGQLLLAEEIATVHLLELSVRTSCRGRGVGGRVLAELFADADATRRAVRYCSCDSAVGARRWLAAHGFETGTPSAPADLVRIPRSPGEAA